MLHAAEAWTKRAQALPNVEVGSILGKSDDHISHACSSFNSSSHTPTSRVASAVIKSDLLHPLSSSGCVSII
jgi:hypothetical protein